MPEAATLWHPFSCHVKQAIQLLRKRRSNICGAYQEDTSITYYVMQLSER
jgi:hypothetical protein